MAVSASAANGESFEAGRIFAGRYRLVHRLRSSGSTDVWRADDLDRDVPVAVQIVRASDDERQEVLRQIDLVRGVTHPAVCRVLDAGDADGRVYCARELVNGESLRTVLRRVGRLPSEKVADIGRQLCIGLAALQGAGLQATIDPWDVLLDADGSIRIADFGFGSHARDAGIRRTGDGPAVPAGQGDAPAASPWAHADASAVGAVLYELLAGPGPQGVRRMPPSALVANVDPRLERVILDALSNDPRRRPASPAAMAAALTALPGPAREGWTGWFAAAAAVAAVAGVLTLLAAWLVPSPSNPLTEHDTIVLADFENTTGNPLFDGALKVALAVALEQSPFLRVYPDDRARETLRLMQRAPDERITASVARDIARRERLKALVAGSIGTIGERFLVRLLAIEASTGTVMAQEHVEVPSADDVLRALGTAAGRLRGHLGESLASIQRFDAPLPQATTRSLEALHAYSIAQEQGQMVRAEAIPHLQQALGLDPGFAMAYAALSGVYRNTGRSGEAPAFSRRAFELRDRVSERERFFISWRYYVDAAQSWDDALRLSVSWTQTYPREAFAFNSLGLASAAFGDHEQAVRAFLEAIRLDPAFVPPYGNLVGSLMASDDFREARARLSEANDRHIAFITVRRMAYLLAFIADDAAAMARELDLVRASSDAVWADIWEARTAAFAEQTQSAHDLFHRGVQAAIGSGARELAAQWSVEDAEVHAIAGECEAVRTEVPAGLALSRDNFTLERAARALVLCGDGDAADAIVTELRTRFPDATLIARIHLPVIGALDALRRGNPARALDLLNPVRPYDRAPSAEGWPAYVRGEAYLQLNDGPAAAAQFRTIVDHRGQAPTSPLYLLARRKLSHAEALTREAAAPPMSARRAQ